MSRPVQTEGVGAGADALRSSVGRRRVGRVFAGHLQGLKRGGRGAAPFPPASTSLGFNLVTKRLVRVVRLLKD